MFRAFEVNIFLGSDVFGFTSLTSKSSVLVQAESFEQSPSVSPGINLPLTATTSGQWQKHGNCGSFDSKLI